MLLKAINDMLLAIDSYNAGQIDDGLICIRFKNYLPGDPVVEVQLTDNKFLEMFRNEEFSATNMSETFFKLKFTEGVINYVALMEKEKNRETFMG